jgi:hypothetical protein
LVCEALCANVAQFPIQPSTQLLRDHTAFLYMRGDGPLLITLDAATLAVARGQTDVANQAQHYAVAADLLERYQGQLDRQLSLGRATAGQVALLGGYATTLIDRLRTT